MNGTEAASDGVADVAAGERPQGEIDARGDALKALAAANVPHLVAGAYAFHQYTGIFRDTKDLDVFLRERDLEAALAALEGAGFRTHIEDPSWIAKGFRGEWFVDLIHSSGNGVAVVDDAWFEHANPGTVLGHPVLLAPPEEMIWSKGFVLERERYDGHDVNHLLHACADGLDWGRLLTRFERYPEVLLAHLLMFRFTYPGERERVPGWVMDRLFEQARTHDVDAEGVCRGPLISRVQYRHDLEVHGYACGRRWDEAERADGKAGDGGRERDVPAGGGR
jgi:hypothetical protein